MKTTLCALSRARDHLVARWKSVPYLCSFCGCEVDPDTIGSGESVGWCPGCQRVFQLPLLKIPSWIAGTVLLLAIKLHAGF